MTTSTVTTAWCSGPHSRGWPSGSRSRVEAANVSAENALPLLDRSDSGSGCSSSIIARTTAAVMDTWGFPRENGVVARPGASRQQLARSLNAAYASGLLSQETFERRVDQVLKARLLDPFRIIGDLNLRRSARTPKTKLMRAAASRMKVPHAAASGEGRPILLALDWNGGTRNCSSGVIAGATWSSRT